MKSRFPSGLTAAVLVGLVLQAWPVLPSVSSAGVQQPAATIPGAPSGLGVTVSYSTRTITFTWRPPTFGGVPTSYVIEVGLSPGARDLLNVDTGNTTTRYAYQGLPPDGTYYARVRARNADGTSEPSNEVTFTISCATPDPPAGLTYRADGAVVTLTWIPAEPLDLFSGSWEIEIGTSPGSPSWTIVSTGSCRTVVGGRCPWLFIEDVTPGVYFMRVRTVSSCGPRSIPSEELRVEVGGPASTSTFVINEFAPRFVELRNQGNSPVAIGGWRIHGPGTSLSAVIPPGVVLGPECYYLAGGGCCDARGGGGIALVRPDGQVVDQVGVRPWDMSSIPLTPYHEGGFLGDGREFPINSSYHRNGPDTNNNGLDFTLISPPLPQHGCGPGPTAPGPPINLTASVSGSTVTFGWIGPTTGSAPTTYVLEVGSSPGASNVLNVETGSTATSYTATNVPAGRYYARVRARNNAGTSGPSSEISFTVVGGLSPPGAPSNLTASVWGSTVRFNWTAPSTGGAPTTYVVEIGTSSGATNVLNQETGSTGTSYSTTLASGTYYARVRARNSAGTSDPSNEVSFGAGVPGPPSNLAAAVSGSTVTFTWAPPTTGGAPTTYVLLVGTAPGCSDRFNNDTGSAATSYTLTNVEPGTYCARVRARNDAGIGPPSNEITVVVGGVLPPGAPSNLTASVSGSTVTLTWSAPTAGGAPTTYVVEMGTSPGSSNLVNRETGSNATTYSAFLGAGTYYARVRARNRVGVGPPSNEVAVIVDGGPCSTRAISVGTTVSGELSDSDCTAPHRSPIKGDVYTFPGTAGTPVTIAMDRITLGDPYVILVSPAGSVLSEDNESGIDGNALIANYSLATSGIYTIEATSFCSSDRGSYTLSLGRGDTGAPGRPTNLTASTGSSTVTLTWNSPTTGGAPTDYVIQAGSFPGATNRGVFGTGDTATIFTATNVPHGTYFIRVRARNSFGVSEPSDQVSFTLCAAGLPCIPAPGAPSGLVALVSGSAVILTWNAPTTGGPPSSYVIEAGSTCGRSNLATYDTGSTATTITVPQVPPGTYYVRVRVRNLSGISGPSNEVLLILP